MFIPNGRLSAVEYGDENRAQVGVRLHALPEPVIRDARAEVVDVMKADVAREPLQYPR